MITRREVLKGCLVGTVYLLTPNIITKHIEPAPTAKAWVHFSGGDAPMVKGNKNVSSVIFDKGNGTYTINFKRPLK